MPPEIDPTQPGGQEEVKPTANPRNAVLAQIAQTAHASVAGEMAGFNEDTGEIEKKADTPSRVVEEVPADRAEIQQDEPAKADPPAPKMVSIVVDGQTIEVEETRIIEAGKRTLQKDHAADRRLQEAVNTKRQAEALLAQAQRLSTPDAANHETTPSQDASQPAPQQIFDPVAIDTYLENKLYMRDAQKAAEKFKVDFPEIAGDPHLMNMAASLENQRLNTVTALGESFGDPFDAYRRHGEEVRKWLQARTGALPPATAQAIEDKQERKRTITAVQAVNAKAPTPAAPKVLSTAELIEQMRESRTRGRVIQRTK